MRPHRLALSAFGPFAGVVEVDLDALAAAGLFLLQGETGAGKTTLLDAVGFALYGRVPGQRQKAARLRSDHADAAVRTSVQLEVTLSGRRLRVTRSPQQDRPKSRGTGCTTEPARVLLEELRAGGWVTVSTRVGEADDELQRLVGMSADQFFSVVLLPQGEFARFLKAESKERGDLLQRLFGTERYAAVEKWLAEQRVGTARRVDQARQAVAVLVARLGQAADLDPPVLPAEEPGGMGDVAAWGATVLASARQAASAFEAEVAAVTARRDVKAATLVAEQRREQLQARRRSAVRRQDLARQAGTAHRMLAAELQAAARAAELAPMLAEADGRHERRVAAAAAEAAARAGLAAVGVAVGESTGRLRQRAEQDRRRLGALEALRPLADELAVEERAAAQAGEAATTARTKLAGCEATLDRLPGQRNAALRAVDTAREAQLAVPERRAEVQRLVDAVSDAERYAVAQQSAADLREQALSARETLLSLRTKESELRVARYDSMIAELSATLVQDAPCPVCGSTSHSDPSELDDERVTREDEERARFDADDVARHLAELEALMAAAEERGAGSRARLVKAGCGAATPGTLRTLLGQARQAAADAAAAATRAAPAAAHLAELDAAQAEATRRAAEARSELEAALRRAQEGRERAARTRCRLATELAGEPDLATARRRAVDRLRACEAAALAAEHAERAADDALRTATALSVACASVGTEPTSARSALRSPVWREQAEQRLRGHDDELAAVAALLADPELDVPLQPAADPAAAGVGLAEADRVLREALQLHAEHAGRAAAVGALLPELDRSLSDLVPLEQQALQVRRLADLCAGGGANTLRMSLTSFVLAARLEQVAAAASERLLRMSQGRYRLVHTDGTARGGARAGLGLLARDSWTGQDRETATLSGGETFLASLALALGLADVVTAESGGAPIDALFVDEGFGSLDEQTLDEVMDVLDGLREGGRVVGVVSHVPELRARIPAQAQVRRTRSGSDVQVVGC